MPAHVNAANPGLARVPSLTRHACCHHGAQADLQTVPLDDITTIHSNSARWRTRQQLQGPRLQARRVDLQKRGCWSWLLPTRLSHATTRGATCRHMQWRAGCHDRPLQSSRPSHGHATHRTPGPPTPTVTVSSGLPHCVASVVEVDSRRLSAVHGGVASASPPATNRWGTPGSPGQHRRDLAATRAPAEGAQLRAGCCVLRAYQSSSSHMSP